MPGVRQISPEEAIEITELRRAVEALVAARAAERVTDEEITELTALGEAMNNAVAQTDMLGYSDLNAKLHTSVRRIARHHTATRVIEQLHGQMVRHQFRLALVPGRMQVSLRQHLDIIDAICARDPERAELAMRAHLDSVLEMLTTVVMPS